MKLNRLVTFSALAVLLATAVHAEEFTTTGKPSFAAIQQRQVYGYAIYDLTFTGSAKNSAGLFLESIIKDKFGNSEGNYIVTLDVSKDGQKIVTEPLIAASWQKKKLLFITTSEKSSIEAKLDGRLLDDFVVDDDTNEVGLSVKVHFSEDLSVDMALFKEVSGVSRTAAVSAFVPGLASVAAAYTNFAPILEQLLKHYTEKDLVVGKTGTFTLLGANPDFGNQFNYRNNQFSLNIYLKTRDSQMSNSFKEGKFVNPDPELALAVVKSGVDAARAKVFDIILDDNGAANADLKNFVTAVTAFEPYKGNYTAAPVRPQCNALKIRLTNMITSRDANLVYWAFLANYAAELQKYADGKQCADAGLRHSLTDLGLVLDPALWPPT